MGLGLMLAEREDRGIPAVGLETSRVVDRQPGIIAELGTRNTVRLILVIERAPFARDVALGQGRADSEKNQREGKPSCSHRGYIMGMKRMIVAGVLGFAIASAPASRAAAPIPVMLLDGESGGPYHDWPRVTQALKKILDETGLFAVTVVTAPATTGELTTFAPEFGPYKAVVMNYDAPDERWPAALKTS